MDEDEIFIRILKNLKGMFKPNDVYSGEEIQLHIDLIIIKIEKGYTPQR